MPKLLLSACFFPLPCRIVPFATGFADNYILSYIANIAVILLLFSSRGCCLLLADDDADVDDDDEDGDDDEDDDEDDQHHHHNLVRSRPDFAG